MVALIITSELHGVFRDQLPLVIVALLPELLEEQLPAFLGPELKLVEIQDGQEVARHLRDPDEIQLDAGAS